MSSTSFAWTMSMLYFLSLKFMKVSYGIVLVGELWVRDSTTKQGRPHEN